MFEEAGVLNRRARPGCAQSSSLTIAARIAMCGLVSSATWSSSAHAVGFVRLESNGFLKKSTERANQSSMLILSPQLSHEGKILKGELDVQAIGFMTDRSSFTLESKNSYLSTSTQLMPHHQVSIGRRYYDWSVVDDSWKMGMWSPRFLYDPLRPEQVGLTGAFYTYQSAKWRFLAYGSPLSIPERGFPVRQDNGRLVSPSPFHVEPYKYVQFSGQRIPIRYSIQDLNLSKILFNPGAAASLRYGDKQGVWVQGMYGLLPIHQVNLTIEPTYTIQPGVAEIPVYARVLHHHIATAEMGHRTDTTNAWVSFTGEAPLQKAIPENQIAGRMGPSYIASVGGDIRVVRTVKLSGSAIYIHENLPPIDTSSIDVDLSPRFQFKRAYRVGSLWDLSERLNTSANWTHDVLNSSRLMSFDFNLRFGHRVPTARSGVWLVNLGADFFASQTDKGFIGQYNGNDRVRGGLSYAF